MHVVCPACHSTLALPQGLVQPTLMECTGCFFCFTANPPESAPLRPIVIPPRHRTQPDPNVLPPQTPVILPPRRRRREKTTSTSHPVHRPNNEAEAYPISQPVAPAAPRWQPSSPPPQQAPAAYPPVLASFTESPVSEPKKKKKPKRFKKKRVVSDDSSGHAASEWGFRLAASVIILIVALIAGATMGVGKFGFLKSNAIGDFNDKVVTLLQNHTTHIDKRIVFAMDQDRIQKTRASLSRGVEELNSFTVPSEAREFHQAAVRFLQRLERVFSTDLAHVTRESQRHINPQGFYNDDMMRLLQELSALEDNLIRAQEEMARRNNFTLSQYVRPRYR